MYPFDLGRNGENVNRIVDDLHRLAGLGVTVAHGNVADVAAITPLELLGDRVLPAVLDT